MLLIVGGVKRDTHPQFHVRWCLRAASQHPGEFAKVKANRPDRQRRAWKSSAGRRRSPAPRRTAIEDIEFGGHTIRKGDKVAMWYLSGNRDEEGIDRPMDFIVDRPRVPGTTFPSVSASTAARQPSGRTASARAVRGGRRDRFSGIG